MVKSKYNTSEDMINDIQSLQGQSKENMKILVIFMMNRNIVDKMVVSNTMRLLLVEKLQVSVKILLKYVVDEKVPD